MKTNPWMIVSLVLAFACGCIVGSKPENEAEAAKPDWAYSMSAPLGQIIALRWDRNLENPMPEMMLIPSKSYDLNTIEANLGKWNKVEMVKTVEQTKDDLEDWVPPTMEEIETIVERVGGTEEEKEANRRMFQEARKEWERDN